MVREHTTEMKLAAAGTHEGTDAIVSAIIDKLGELVHGCALLTSAEIKIKWIEGGTYETCLTEAEIRDSSIDPEQRERNLKIRKALYEFIEGLMEYRGALWFYQTDTPKIIQSIEDAIDFVAQENLEWAHNLDIDKVNWLFIVMDVNYRINKIDESRYEFTQLK